MFFPLRTALSVMVICLVLAWPLTARAGLPPDLVKDFQPVSGHVVMPINGQFLIDLDAVQGTAVGDLISVVKPGRQIVDPATGKVLGAIDEVKGLLRVTRIRNGYSYARPVGPTKGIAAGDQIRRFENMQATFWDYTGRGEPLFTELRQALPHLDWQPYAAAQKARPAAPARPPKGGPAVIFILTSTRLEARDAAFNLLHDYPAHPEVRAAETTSVPAPAPTAPEAPRAKAPTSPSSAAAPVVPSPIVTAPTPVPIVSAGKAAPAKPAAPSPAAGLWKSPPMKGTPVGVAVGDFDGDGRQEIAVAFSDHLQISRVVDGHSEALARVPLGRAQALGLDAFDLDGDGKPELYVTADWNQYLASEVVAYGGSGYRVTQKEIPWYFRRVALPGQGPTLLGERMGAGQEDFAGPIFRVRRANGRLKPGAAISAPSDLTLYSFLPLPTAKGHSVYVTLSGSDHLQVLSAQGEVLWESAAVFGGNETSFERPDASESRQLFLKARLALTPQGNVLATANEGSRIFARHRNFNRSRLVALKWDGSALQELWHTWPQDGYLADFCVADANNDGHPDLTTVLGFGTGGFFGSLFGSGHAAIYLYKLP